MSAPDSPVYRPDTLAVRAGIERTPFGEHGDAMYLTSSFVFENAAQAARRFAGEEEGYVYARFSNPTVTAMQTRLAALEGAEACIATASGMSAIMSLAMATLQAGDHVVASNGLFGATQQLFGGILSRFGIETTFVPATDLNAWRDAITPRTRLFFSETPSNPLTEVIDIAGVASIAREAGVLFAGGQLLLLARAAAPPGSWRRRRRSFGDEVSGRAGARARWRGRWKQGGDR